MKTIKAFITNMLSLFPQNEKQTPQEQKLFKILEGLIRSHLDWISQGVLKGVRLRWRQRPIRVETTPKPDPALPIGPFLPTRHKQRGDLLLFVPRALNSLLIDDLTGKYGYSHVAVDCGETDLPTGKPVMIESTVGQPVERRFLDEYGGRYFARIPISRVGVDIEQFCDCIESKLGQPYDSLEALTWGQIDDPAKQICSDLAAVCLPETMREDIAHASRAGIIRRASVSVHSRPSTHGIREFISPNGFAEYFGAPKGKEIDRADQLISPRLATTNPKAVLRPYLWKVGVTLTAGTVLWLWIRNLIYRPYKARPKSASALRVVS